MSDSVKIDLQDMTDGFKLTELGPLPEEWEVVKFENSVLKQKVRVGKVQQQEYGAVGKYPIIDQSQNFIVGYWDDDAFVYHGDLPVIIFGDHTRIFKFVDFPFICGADGTKVLVPNKSLFDPAYLFFALSHLDIPSRGYNRHFPLLKQKAIPLPPLSEQHAIARVLSTIQRAVEVQHKLIAAARELKKSLMSHFFTYGPVPLDQAEQVPLQETEIGQVPEHWRIVELGNVVKIAYGLQAAVAHSIDKSVGIPILTNINITNEGVLDLSTLRYYQLPEKKREKLILQKGDLLFNWRSGSQAHVGKTAIFDLGGEYTFSSFILRFRVNEMVNNRFLFYYLQNIKSQGFFAQKRDQSSVNSVFNASLASKIPVVIPPLSDQREIARILSTVDKKIEAEEKRKVALQTLFKTMLHLLMTGRIRVKDLEVKA